MQGIRQRIVEAAKTLRASRPQIMTTVTLSLMKPGLANASLVGFIESIVDFGNPVIGGHALRLHRRLRAPWVSRRA